ncbi:MAG: T9SS type A sorting domain-containing protein, partial [Bacteroidota bacterium]
SGYPNPFNDRISIQFLSDKKIKQDLNLYDSQGRIILKQEIMAEIGENNLLFDLTPYNLSKGLYVIKLSNIESVQQIKIIKE